VLPENLSEPLLPDKLALAAQPVEVDPNLRFCSTADGEQAVLALQEARSMGNLGSPLQRAAGPR
jgi:hypothetical protein